jgi:hypothetical protein
MAGGEARAAGTKARRITANVAKLPAWQSNIR